MLETCLAYNVMHVKFHSLKTDLLRLHINKQNLNSLILTAVQYRWGPEELFVDSASETKPIQGPELR
jgi:hypothetical protein